MFELVGDGREIGWCRGVCRLVWGQRREFGCLGAEVFEPRLEPQEPFVAALGREPALLEGVLLADAHALEPMPAG
jgi:hypothetical protein